jgi:hypothetical protein
MLFGFYTSSSVTFVLAINYRFLSVAHALLPLYKMWSSDQRKYNPLALVQLFVLTVTTINVNVPDHYIKACLQCLNLKEAISWAHNMHYSESKHSQCLRPARSNKLGPIFHSLFIFYTTFTMFCYKQFDPSLHAQQRSERNSFLIAYGRVALVRSVSKNFSLWPMHTMYKTGS